MAKTYARLRATISKEGQARAEKQARQLLTDMSSRSPRSRPHSDLAIGTPRKP